MPPEPDTLVELGSRVPCPVTTLLKSTPPAPRLLTQGQRPSFSPFSRHQHLPGSWLAHSSPEPGLARGPVPFVSLSPVVGPHSLTATQLTPSHATFFPRLPEPLTGLSSGVSPPPHLLSPGGSVSTGQAPTRLCTRSPLCPRRLLPWTTGTFPRALQASAQVSLYPWVGPWSRIHTSTPFASSLLGSTCLFF